MENKTMMQYFEWYIPADKKHWIRIKENASKLKKRGIDMIWLPPAFKATGEHDVGYGVYDLYDLGEFDQKGTIPTKYGTKDEYLDAIQSLQQEGIFVIADIVLNHKASGDYKERFYVLKMDSNQRQIPISQPYEIEGWTGFNFSGRNNQYSDFKWHWYHFNGIDYDALHDETGLYLILGDGKGWSDQVDGEHGNYDYLMFNNIDYNHPEVVSHLKKWVKWFLETTKINGFRLDAVKHIKYDFMVELIDYIKREVKSDLYVFGEYWKGDSDSLSQYIRDTERKFDLVDVVLHMNLFNASKNGNGYDLTKILDGSLMKYDDMKAVTFVDNHDSQRGQALESCIEEWFKPIAYSIILLRQQGLPCVFYGDYYGIEGEFAQMAFKEVIDKLLYIRKNYVYGNQIDYFDHPNCIGWVNTGNENYPNGSAVVISNSEAGHKNMDMGILNAGKEFIDYLGNCSEKVVIGEDGWAIFPVEAGSVSVWIDQESIN